MYTHNYFPTYLPTSLSLSLSPYRTLPTLPYVAAFLPTHLLACLPSYLPADLPAFLPTCMGTVTSATQPCSYLLAGKRPTYQAICVDAHDIPTYLPTYIHTYSHTYIHTSLHAFIHCYCCCRTYCCCFRAFRLGVSWHSCHMRQTPDHAYLIVYRPNCIFSLMYKSSS